MTAKRTPKQRTLKLPPPPTPARIVIGIDPSVTDGAAVAIYCPGSADLAAGARPELLQVWSWRASTAKAAAHGLRLTVAQVLDDRARRLPRSDQYASLSQVGAQVAIEVPALQAMTGRERRLGTPPALVIACEHPPATRFTASSAAVITWASGLLCAHTLANCPTATLLRPYPRQWRMGLGLPPGDKPTADLIATRFSGWPADLGAALGRGELSADVVEAAAIALWAGLTEGCAPKRAPKKRARAASQES